MTCAKLALLIVALSIGADAWVPGFQLNHRNVALTAKKKANPVKASGGFGAKPKVEAAAEPKGVGTGIKALKTQYANFVELKDEGAAVFEAYVRKSVPPEGTKGGWCMVGFVNCENDDPHTAVQVQQALILEHSEAVFPGFALIRSSLEAGFRSVPAEGDEETTDDVTALVRKPIPIGSVKAGYQNLVPIAVETMKSARN